MPRQLLLICLAAVATLLLPPSAAGHNLSGRSYRPAGGRGANYWHFRWGGSTWPRGFARPRVAAPPDPAWAEVVPARLAAAPAEVARLSWPGTRRLGLNSTVLTGWAEDRPVLRWSADRRSLYTVLIVDEGIARLEGRQFVHWMVTNIPGSDVGRGAEVVQYIPPFSVELLEDGSGVDKDGAAHPMLVLVYRQPGRVEVEEIQRGCAPSILTDRHKNIKVRSNIP